MGTQTFREKARIWEEENIILRAELVLLAKLASDRPEFYNPGEAMRAKKVRDRILKG